MEAAHRYYLLGSLFFMANDPAVNSFTRYAIGRWGMCADEYTATDHFPPQLYIRISNRLRGEVLLTQNNLALPQAKPDSVAVGKWSFDQHTESRRAVLDTSVTPSRWVALNEGYMRQPFSPGDWYDLPFSVMLPQRAEAANLLVSVAISATSVAYSSTRIEQMFVDAGAAAGVGAGHDRAGERGELVDRAVPGTERRTVAGAVDVGAAGGEAKCAGEHAGLHPDDRRLVFRAIPDLAIAAGGSAVHPGRRRGARPWRHHPPGAGAVRHR
jgi:hypothetical protein